MTKKFIPGIGESDFRLLRQAKLGFVDKSFFISNVLADGPKVLLFPRPRRFGKTTNLSMLGHFLRKTDENLLPIFEGLSVTNDAEAMKHFQKYPLISISFKDVKEATFDGALQRIAPLIRSVYEEHRYILETGRLPMGQLEVFARILSGNATKYELQDSFKWLSQALYEHHRERVAILIDEYDTPIHTAYVSGYFDEIVTFFRTFFSACLKDNSALFKGVLTGILRVARENMFSDLNHIKVRSIIDEPYATAFGFTEDEVKNIIAPERLEEVRRWYNGYIFGGQVIYNPWSIINYIDSGKLEPYWVNTGGTNLIERLALKQGLALSDKSTVLLNGGTIDQVIESNIVLRDIDRSSDAFWNFLLFAGYLKPVDLKLVVGKYQAKLAIPNEEVRLVYQDLFRTWLYQLDPQYDAITPLIQGLLSGDAPIVEENLQTILMRVMSFYDAADAAPERMYHGFVLGMLVHLEKEYEVRSNREAGYGRADVIMRPRTPGRPGVVIEFKVKKPKQAATIALEEAAEQVREKHYADELRAAGMTPVYEYAMAFDGKKAYVKLVEDVLRKKKKAASKGTGKTKKRSRG